MWSHLLDQILKTFAFVVCIRILFLDTRSVVCPPLRLRGRYPVWLAQTQSSSKAGGPFVLAHDLWSFFAPLIQMTRFFQPLHVTSLVQRDLVVDVHLFVNIKKKLKKHLISWFSKNADRSAWEMKNFNPNLWQNWHLLLYKILYFIAGKLIKEKERIVSKS